MEEQECDEYLLAKKFLLRGCFNRTNNSALRWTQYAVDYAVRSGDDNVLAEALYHHTTVGLLISDLPLEDARRLYTQSLGLFDRTNDRVFMARVRTR